MQAFEEAVLAQGKDPTAKLQGHDTKMQELVCKIKQLKTDVASLGDKARPILVQPQPATAALSPSVLLQALAPFLAQAMVAGSTPP